MPHFENLDQYEVTNRKSGKKEIVPIAPHSLQKADYRPRPRPEGARKDEETVPDFPEVEIEPISVQQMEKEFRMAARKSKHSRGRRKKSLFKKILKWFRQLFGGKKSKKKSARGSKPRHQRQRSGKNPSKGQSGRSQQGRNQRNRNQRSRNEQGKEAPEGQSGGNRRRRRRKSSGSRQGGQGGQGGQAKSGSGENSANPQAKKRRRRRPRGSGNASKDNSQ